MYKERKRAIERKSTNLDEVFKLKASATIRKFTKCKNLKVIEPTVKTFEIDNETVFASKMTLSYFSEVSKGIHKFHNYNKKSKSASNKTDSTSCDESDNKN